MKNIFSIVIYILSFISLFGLLEFISYKNWLKPESTRRIAHVGSALISFTFPMWLERDDILLLSGIFVVFLAFSKRVMLFKAIHQVKRETWGELYFPLAVGASALITLPQSVISFQLAMLIMGISDVAANIIGTYLPWKSFRVFGTPRTISGSLAFAFSACSILLFAHVNISFAIAIATVLALVEVLSPQGSDNLTISVVACVILKLML